MSSIPAISVIMSVYNSARYLYAAVESILNQDFNDFEFIIVNDGSTDNSGEILVRLAQRDPRIRVISRENRGLVTSLNELVASARAPLLARMDADDVAMPRRLSLQHSYMMQNPDVGVLGTNTHELDENGRVYACIDFYPNDHTGIEAMLHRHPPVCHPSVMMRTALVRDNGGYRAAFRHAEDYDLWLRLFRVTEIRNLPDRLLLYRRTAEQVSQRHAVEQSLSAQVAWMAHQNVLSGKIDPFDTIPQIPAIADLDALLDRPGSAAIIHKKLVEQSRYAPDMLHGAQFPMMLEQASRPGAFAGAWRTALRLLLSGEPSRAISLSAALLFKR
jgi:glycosyltransferase involved in cell wall biosynthesis